MCTCIHGRGNRLASDLTLFLRVYCNNIFIFSPCLPPSCAPPRWLVRRGPTVGRACSFISPGSCLHCFYWNGACTTCPSSPLLDQGLSSEKIILSLEVFYPFRPFMASSMTMLVHPASGRLVGALIWLASGELLRLACIRAVCALLSHGLGSSLGERCSAMMPLGWRQDQHDEEATVATSPCASVAVMGVEGYR